MAHLTTPSPTEVAQHLAPPAARYGSAASRGRELGNDGDDVHGLLPCLARAEVRWQGKNRRPLAAGQTQAKAALAG